MTEIYSLATLWLALALLATLVSIWLRIATAMSEIIVGTVAQLIIGAALGAAALGTDQSWIKFLAGTGAVVLTFLAGAELDPQVMRREWKQATIVGMVAFAAPFLGCAAVARFVVGWDSDASWLAGIALSTTSVAVVYAVMLEFGLNRTEYGKIVLAACFVNDLATVLMLGLKFSPFTLRTLAFAGGSAVTFFIMPWLVPRFFRRYGGRPSELEAKLLLLTMFGLGALALWAGTEPVLPAYILGMILAGTVGKDHALVRRLRTLTFGLLTPFYFIRAGSFVSIPALVAAPGILVVLLAAKMISKFAGVYPITKLFKSPTKEAMYTTLLMSTGLTFGSISALFGLTHRIITQQQYSYLIAAVIGSAIVPTLIANAFFLPHHLMHRTAVATERAEAARVPRTEDLKLRCPPMFKRILLGYDGSEPAKKAFEQCLEMARCFDAQLSIVTVVRPPEFAEDVETEAIIENARSHYESELGKLRTRASIAGVQPAIHIRVGHPAEQIIAAAEEWNADLIVTGHRGKGLFERWLLGSVSRVVIAYARCAVLVIR